MSKDEEKKPIPPTPIPDISALYRLAMSGSDLNRPASDAETVDKMRALSSMLAGIARNPENTRLDPADGTYSPTLVLGVMSVVTSITPTSRPADRPLETIEQRDARKRNGGPTLG